MSVKGTLLSLLLAIAVGGCAPPLNPPIVTLASLPTVYPTLSPAPRPTPSPTATSLPTRAPTPSPIAPTLDPADVVATISAGEVTLAARQVGPLCLWLEDTSGDGIQEWIGLYLRPSEPPRLAAFVIGNDGAWYDLEPQEGSKYGLGVYATCELAVQDINADGIAEILIYGHAEANTTLLHVFAWDQADYVLVAAFEGTAGVTLENRDGDPIDEIVVGYVKGADLAWEVVYTWDGTSYGWTWDRYRWRTLARPHTYSNATPEAGVISFYLAVNDRDLPAAHRMLSTAAQANSPYPEWALAYATTLAVEVGAVREARRSDEGRATVAAYVRSYDNVNGRVVGRLWDVEWTLVQENGAWRLENATVAPLDQWEATYYP